MCSAPTPKSPLLAMIILSSSNGSVVSNETWYCKNKEHVHGLDIADTLERQYEKNTVLTRPSPYKQHIPSPTTSNIVKIKSSPFNTDTVLVTTVEGVLVNTSWNANNLGNASFSQLINFPSNLLWVLIKLNCNSYINQDSILRQGRWCRCRFRRRRRIIRIDIVRNQSPRALY